MATLQASASYKHRLTWLKYGGVAISRDSYFQSSNFTWNQNGTGQKDAMNVEAHHPRPALGLWGGWVAPLSVVKSLFPIR